MLNQWINKKYLDDVSGLHWNFIDARPYPHIQIDDILREDKANLLREALLEEEFFHKESDLFSLSQTNDLSESKSEIIKSFYIFLASKEFAEFIRKLTGINVKPSALDLAGSLYTSGDYLLCHDDQLEDRRIAYIFYLCVNFEKEDGARFLVFDDNNGKPGKAVRSYVPKWNSLMLFQVSNLSFHAVEENVSDKERLAIGGWLH